MKNFECVIYARVSSKEQEETGYSLPAQEKFLSEYANREEINLRVKKTFSVSESACGLIDRKVFLEMMEYLTKNSITNIVVESTDRLTRNFADVRIIDKWIMKNENNKVHLVKEGCILHKNSKSHEWFMWRVKVATAEYYVRLLSDNVRKGQKEKIAQGWLPTKPPIGYKTEGEKGHKIHIIDENKAPMIKKMFKLYASGEYSLTTLVTKMHKLGFRTRGGNKLVKSRMGKILSDPFYIGKNRWNGELYDGKQEPLIEKRLFNEVQNRLHRKTTPRYGKRFFILKGMIKCSRCGGSITWEEHKGHVYGHCNIHYHKCDNKVWVREDEVENKLMKIIDDFQLKESRLFDWVKKALKESHKDEIDFREASFKELNTRREQIQRVIDRLYDDRLNEKVPEELYERKYKQYKEEQEAVIESLKKQQVVDFRYKEMGMSLFELSQKATIVYEKLRKKNDIEERRKMFMLIFDNINLEDGGVSYDFKESFKILGEAVEMTRGSIIPKFVKIPNENIELPDFGSTKEQSRDFVPARPAMLRERDSNPRPSG